MGGGSWTGSWIRVYIELHCASAFSFLEGASLPETLVERAAALGYPALALLDRDGVYGAPRFHKAARAAGMKPIIGCELTMGTCDVGQGTWDVGWGAQNVEGAISPPPGPGALSSPTRGGVASVRHAGLRAHKADVGQRQDPGISPLAHGACLFSSRPSKATVTCAGC